MDIQYAEGATCPSMLANQFFRLGPKIGTKPTKAHLWQLGSDEKPYKCTGS